MWNRETPVQSVVACLKFHAFWLESIGVPETLLFCVPKDEPEKAPATFEARAERARMRAHGSASAGGHPHPSPAVTASPDRASPGRRRCSLGGCRHSSDPKARWGWHQVQVASLKDFLCSADWKPSQSPAATAPSKREPLAKPQALWSARKLYRYCQRLSLMRRAGKPDRA